MTVLGSNATTCSPTDTACLCVDNSYQAKVAACVQSTCTVKESLVAKRLGERQCGVPPRPQQNDVASLTVLFTITFFLVIVRLTVKFLGHGGGWGIDDWLMLMAFVSSTAHHFTARKANVIYVVILHCSLRCAPLAYI